MQRGLVSLPPYILVLFSCYSRTYKTPKKSGEALLSKQNLKDIIFASKRITLFHEETEIFF